MRDIKWLVVLAVVLLVASVAWYLLFGAVTAGFMLGTAGVVAVLSLHDRR